MSSPEIDEVLFAYIVVAPHAVSLVLIQVDSGIKRPVYYVSKSLHEAEIRYLPLEKAILAIVHGTRKLPHYCSQYCGSEEKEWEMANMCRFHKFKQGLPKRSLPYASNRPAGRCHCRPSLDELLRRLSRIASNITSPK